MAHIGIWRKLCSSKDPLNIVWLTTLKTIPNLHYLAKCSWFFSTPTPLFIAAVCNNFVSSRLSEPHSPVGCHVVLIQGGKGGGVRLIFLTSSVISDASLRALVQSPLLHTSGHHVLCSSSTRWWRGQGRANTAPATSGGLSVGWDLVSGRSHTSPSKPKLSLWQPSYQMTGLQHWLTVSWSFAAQMCHFHGGHGPVCRDYPSAWVGVAACTPRAEQEHGCLNT